VCELASAAALSAQLAVHQKILFWSSRFKALCSLSLWFLPATCPAPLRKFCLNEAATELSGSELALEYANADLRFCILCEGS